MATRVRAAIPRHSGALHNLPNDRMDLYRPGRTRPPDSQAAAAILRCLIADVRDATSNTHNRHSDAPNACREIAPVRGKRRVVEPGPPPLTKACPGSPIPRSGLTCGFACGDGAESPGFDGLPARVCGQNVVKINF